MVNEAMSRDVEFIEADAMAQQAAELMEELAVGALPVGTPAQVVRVVTDRDILYRVGSPGPPEFSISAAATNTIAKMI